MKFVKTSALLALLSVASINAQTLKSPDGKFEMNFNLKNGIPYYNLKYNGNVVVEDSKLGLRLLKDGDIQFASEIENKNSNFYFLIVNNQVAGYLKVNEGDAQTERVADNALEVERIYLKQNFQHQGFGLVLIKLAEELARKKNKANMWLGVWEKNYQAQAFYKKDGFKRVSQHTFVVGDDPQTDFILVKELK